MNAVADKPKSKNIVDYYKEMSDDDIRYSLNKNRKNYTVFIHNLTKNLNAGSIVRLCNLNLAKRIVFYGRRDYNRVSAVGSYVWENIDVCWTMDELKNYIKEHNIQKMIGFDNNIGREPNYLHEYQWDKNIHYGFFFGCEATGVDEEVLNICDDIVQGKQLGCCRSYNVSNFASMVMYDFLLKTGGFN